MDKHRLLYISLVWIILACPGNVLSQRQIDPDLESFVEHIVENVYLPMVNHAPLSLSIVQGNGSELLYSTGYGLANREKNIPVSNQTQFMTGSVSKNFAATFTVKILHETFPEMGEAVLDTPIRKLMPQVNFTMIDRYRSEQTTFRDLLAHRVGTNPNDLVVNAGKFKTVEETLYRSRYNEQIFPFRGGMSYDGEMITMACELAALLVNKPFNEAFDDFMAELGMHNTTFLREEDDFEQMPWRAGPYYVKDDEFLPMNAELSKRLLITNPAGGLFTTADDMTRYMKLYLNKGNLDGRQIIPAEVMSWFAKPINLFPELMTYKQSEDDVFLLSIFGYGLGTMLGSYHDWEYVFHGGNAPPYLCILSYFPVRDLGVFSCTNSAPIEGAAVYILHMAVFEILNGNSKAAAVENALQAYKEVKAKEDKKKEKEQAEHIAFIKSLKKKAELRQDQVEVVGYYGSGGLGDLEITERFNEETNQNQLYLNYSVWFTGWLEGTDNATVYDIKWDTDVVQDGYLVGDVPPEYAMNIIIVEEDRLGLVGTMGFGGWFQRDLRSDQLPEIPWSPDSCGPETFKK